MTVAYRNASPRDRDFIVSGWLWSYREAHSAGFISMESWPAVMTVEIARCLDLPDTTTVVAYDTDEPADSKADLYGFICADITRDPIIIGNEKYRCPLVHYVYVKAAYRRSGLARGLFRAIGVDPRSTFAYSCRTAVVSAVSREIPASKWAPLPVRFEKTQPQQKETARGR